MHLRTSLALSLLAASPAFAQPAPKPAAPTQPAQAAPATGGIPPDDLAAFDRDLDALFSSGGLTSDQAAGRAAAVSPTVHRKVAELEAALTQVDAASLRRVPQVSLKASYTRLSHIDPINIPIMIAGTNQNFAITSLQNAYLGEGQLVVPLSDYVVRFPKLVDSARLTADAARLDEHADEVLAGEDARVAYYEWVRAKLQVLVSKRQLIQVQRTLDQVRVLAEVQRLSKADLLRVEAQEADAEQTVDQLQYVADLREEQLRLLIGAGSEQLVIGEDIRVDITPPASGQLDDLVTTAKQQRLEFKRIETGIQAKEAQRSAEKANLYPQLSAFGIADYADPNQRVFPQEDAFKFTWQVGVQLTWTLNDLLISRTTDRRLTAEANELRADHENLERSTRLDVLQAQQAVLLAEHALITSQKGLVSSQESYRVRRELLAADRATAVELVDSETELTRSRITALNARVDLREAQAQLDHAVGNDAKLNAQGRPAPAPGANGNAQARK